MTQSRRTNRKSVMRRGHRANPKSLFDIHLGFQKGLFYDLGTRVYTNLHLVIENVSDFSSQCFEYHIIIDMFRISLTCFGYH